MRWTGARTAAGRGAHARAGAQVLTSELFGLRHMASNQSVVHVAPTLGNLALATYLAGGLYQRTGRANGDPPGTCRGGGCYRRAPRRPRRRRCAPCRGRPAPRGRRPARPCCDRRRAAPWDGGPALPRPAAPVRGSAGGALRRHAGGGRQGHIPGHRGAGGAAGGRLDGALPAHPAAVPRRVCGAQARRRALTCCAPRRRADVRGQLARMPRGLPRKPRPPRVEAHVLDIPLYVASREADKL